MASHRTPRSVGTRNGIFEPPLRWTTAAERPSYRPAYSSSRRITSLTTTVSVSNPLTNTSGKSAGITTTKTESCIARANKSRSFCRLSSKAIVVTNWCLIDTCSALSLARREYSRRILERWCPLRIPLGVARRCWRVDRANSRPRVRYRSRPTVAPRCCRPRTACHSNWVNCGTSDRYVHMRGLWAVTALLCNHRWERMP